MHRAPESSPVFQDGDRWTALGDSITHTGSYHAWIYLYQLTRFPAGALDLVNCGIAGDTAAGALRRLSWDILPTRPTVTTVMFAMNDVGLALYANGSTSSDVLEERRAALNAYQQNMRALVGRLQGAGSRVVLLTPTIFDQTAELPAARQPGVENALAACAEFVQRLGAEMGAVVVDVHEPMLRLNRELQLADPAFTLIGADRMHPGAPGHFAMAYWFLKAQQAPAEVARLAIDGEGARAVVCQNGTVEEIRRPGEHGIAFTWKAEALPFPIDPDFAPALHWVPFMADLNQEILQVTALHPGDYALRIDDMAVGVFSDRELARGVNLAEHPQTPQYQQALDVLRLVQEHRWHGAETLRNLALVEHQTAPAEGQPCTLASIQPLYDRRMEQLRPVQPPGSNLLRVYDLYPQNKPHEPGHRVKLAGLAAEARRAAQPMPRRYELTKIA